MSDRSRSLLAVAALIGGLVAACAPTGARAQTSASTGTMRSGADSARLDSSGAARGSAALIGRVHTPSDVVLADVELTVLGDVADGRSVEGRSGRSGPGGVFRIDSITPGRYFVRARRLGFAPVYFSATLDRGTTRRIDVELAPLAARLAEVDVRAQSGYGWWQERRLHDFEFRRRAGFGRFYTRDDLRPYRGWLLSNALSYVAYAVPQHVNYPVLLPFLGGEVGGCSLGRRGLNGGAASGRYRVISGSAWNDGTNRRVACISIDGAAPVSPELAADLPVDTIEALEVYGSLVVVWTGAETSD